MTVATGLKRLAWRCGRNSVSRMLRTYCSSDRPSVLWAMRTTARIFRGHRQPQESSQTEPRWEGPRGGYRLPPESTPRTHPPGGTLVVGGHRIMNGECLDKRSSTR